MLTEPVSTTTTADSTAEVNDDEASSSRPSFRDYVREGWKDLEVEYRLRKHELTKGVKDTTTGVFHKAYQGTGNAVKGTGRVFKDTVRTVQRDLGDQLEGWKADFWVQKNLVKQDIHDFVRASQDWKRQVAQRRRLQQGRQQETPSTTPAPATETSTDTPHHVRQETLMREIRAFEDKLASDQAFVEELNQLIELKLTFCPDMIEYYQERPELNEYTLTTELPRMQYTVYTEEGQKLTQPDQIVDYAKAHPDCHDILWRAANQSIFGDVISTLTCEEGLVRPQFDTASFVNDVSILLDLGRDQPHITAECFVNVSIPGHDGERLSLAGALVGVYFCPVMSKMEARVLHISASQPLTEDELQGAVDSMTGR